MKVQEFIERMNGSESLKEAGLQVKSYLPIIQKKKIAMDMTLACVDESDGFVRIDRFKMRVYFAMKMIDAYTNLEVANDFNGMVEQYDMLHEHNVFSLVIADFASEYCAMESIVEDEVREILSDNSLEAQVAKIGTKIISVLNVLGDKLNSVDLQTMFPGGADMNQLVNMVNKLK